MPRSWSQTSLSRRGLRCFQAQSSAVQGHHIWERVRARLAAGRRGALIQVHHLCLGAVFQAVQDQAWAGAVEWGQDLALGRDHLWAAAVRPPQVRRVAVDDEDLDSAEDAIHGSRKLIWIRASVKVDQRRRVVVRKRESRNTSSKRG